jgi:pimeloyl-ACP methyl ester carboxylesterase
MPTIECCGSTLFYQLTGAGAPVLLVHSSACRGGFWQGLIQQLGEGCAFYTPDLAGYGRSRCESMSGKTALRDEAEFIAPLLLARYRTLSPDRPFVRRRHCARRRARLAGSDQIAHALRADGVLGAALRRQRRP